MEYNEKQSAIICVAERLFSAKGFDGTSVRDIAQEAGVNVAMISYYFGSKEKLMEAVFVQRGLSIRLKIENLLQDHQLSSLDKIFLLIDDYVEKVMTRQHFHRIMMREQLADRKTPVRGFISELKRRNLESVQKLIQEGQKNGEFKKNIDVPLMVMTMAGIVNQMFLSQRFYRELNNMEGLSDEEYQKHIRKKLRTHLKKIFKTSLTYA